MTASADASAQMRGALLWRPIGGGRDFRAPLASVALALSLTLPVGAAARAGSCADKVAALRASLQQTGNRGGAFVGTAPQSVDAQLEHQPTPASVERAKKNASARIEALLAQAERLDALGEPRECERALQTAKVLLNP
jgi:hypothetical protein